MRRLVPAVLSLAFLAACQPATTELTEEQKAEVVQALAESWAGFKEAVENEDYEGWAAYWTEDAWVLEPGMDLRGDDLFDFVREMFASGADFTVFDAEPLETFVHGDVAYQIGQYDEAFQVPGAEPGEVHNYNFTRWVKEDGVWKIDRLLAGPREALPEG
jgi:ketosteroid isomerase-like protein